MADYNQQRPVSTYNAHQDEFGFKEGDDQDTFQDAPDRMTGYGDTDSGVGGPKSGYGVSKEGGAFDHATGEQTQFGLEGKSGYGHEGADPQLGATDTRAYGAVDPFASEFDDTPRSNAETVPGGDGWSREDTSRTHGAKKDGLVSKIKEKLPGQHHTATGTATEDPAAPPKKGMMEKIKEKMPGNH